MGILDKLTREDLFMSQEDAMKWEEWERNTIYNDGVKEGMEQGVEQGIAQGIEQGKNETLIQTIKEMLKKDFSLTDIRDITGKSMEEIKSIQDNLK